MFELTADDGDTTGEPIRFKLGGKDKALFTVDIANNKSILHFKTPPQGDTPLCSETTPCVITITPSDGINKGAPQTVTITVAPPPPPKRLLNDTGVNFSGYTAHTYNLQLEEKPDINASTCLSATSALGAPQDCNQGRDSVANLSKIGAGKAGFDFTKLGRNGEVLAIQNASYAANGQESPGTQWSCVRDNHTGFVWEVKTRDGSVRDRTRLFSSDTVNQLLQAANSGSGLCGFKDWRVPNIDELSNIVLREKIPGNNQPAMDTDFFPNTQSGSKGYLSATPQSRTRDPYDSYRFRHPEGNLGMRFVGSGLTTRGVLRRAPHPFWPGRTIGGYRGGTWSRSGVGGRFFVRLVRGAPALRQKLNSRYVINGDTVTDQVTQLMWQRCRYGRSGADCTTRSTSIEGPRRNLSPILIGYGWREVLRAAASSTVGGFSDWRVPNINELESLLDYPSRSINSSAFPNFHSSSNGHYYSSSLPPRYYVNRLIIGGLSAYLWGFTFSYTPYNNFASAQFRTTARGWRYVNRERLVDGKPTDLTYFPQQAIFVRDVTPSGTDTPLVVPGGLRATPDDSQVRVSWTAVTGATDGYKLYYSQSPIDAVSPGASPGVKTLQLSTAPTSSNPFTVYELTNEKRYYFRVTAIGAGNTESAPSSQTSALPSKYPGTRTVER